MAPENINMRIIIAKIFKFLFESEFLKKSRFFGIYKRIFKPLNLFKGVVCEIKYNQVQLILHIEDWIQQNIYFLGEYETQELKTLQQFLKEDGIFIDLGANFGLYTLNASKLVGKKGTIICFEPFSQNYKYLSNNIVINNLQNVQAENLAVGEKNGTINLYYDKQEKNLGMVSTKHIENSLKEEVQVVSIDSYLQNKPLSHIDLIKIDIEGFEYSALMGMHITLTKYKPTLLIEILKEEESDNNSKRIHDLLNKLGYRKYFIDDKGNLSENETNSKRFNYIFTTKPLAVNQP